MKHISLKLAVLSAAFILIGGGCSKTEDQPAAPIVQQPQHETVAITLNPQGLDKKEVTIKVGDYVEFRNSDLKDRWPASAPHPQHTDYPEFDPKAGIKPGEVWRFQFTKAGTWKFHDHLNAPNKAFQGTVIVK